MHSGFASRNDYSRGGLIHFPRTRREQNAAWYMAGVVLDYMVREGHGV